MNIGLVIGKKTSTGTPGKNIRRILGRPAAEYAFIAAKFSNIDKTYVSTDCEVISGIGSGYGATVIHRPAELATPESLTEDVLLHAYNFIKSDFPEGTPIHSISLLFANNPAINVNLLNEALECVVSESQTDSCFSVSKFDMFSPVRARKVNEDGMIEPFVDLSLMNNVTSIRNSSGSVYFCDLAIQVMKERCFTEMDSGQLPFKWQGKVSKAIPNDFGFDIDSEWQFIVIEYWLKKHGFTETEIPWAK
jgi:CMP-N-acetylneuraminic acid synthetase